MKKVLLTFALLMVPTTVLPFEALARKLKSAVPKFPKQGASKPKKLFRDLKQEIQGHAAYGTLQTTVDALLPYANKADEPFSFDGRSKPRMPHTATPADHIILKRVKLLTQLKQAIQAQEPHDTLQKIIQEIEGFNARFARMQGATEYAWR